MTAKHARSRNPFLPAARRGDYSRVARAAVLASCAMGRPAADHGDPWARREIPALLDELSDHDRALVAALTSKRPPDAVDYSRDSLDSDEPKCLSQLKLRRRPPDTLENLLPVCRYVGRYPWPREHWSRYSVCVEKELPDIKTYAQFVARQWECFERLTRIVDDWTINVWLAIGDPPGAAPLHGQVGK